MQQHYGIAYAALDVRHAATEDFLVLLGRSGSGRHVPSYLLNCVVARDVVFGHAGSALPSP